MQEFLVWYLIYHMCYLETHADNRSLLTTKIFGCHHHNNIMMMITEF